MSDLKVLPKTGAGALYPKLHTETRLTIPTYMLPSEGAKRIASQDGIELSCEGDEVKVVDWGEDQSAEGKKNALCLAHELWIHLRLESCPSAPIPLRDPDPVGPYGVKLLVRAIQSLSSAPNDWVDKQASQYQRRYSLEPLQCYALGAIDFLNWADTGGDQYDTGTPHGFAIQFSASIIIGHAGLENQYVDTIPFEWSDERRDMGHEAFLDLRDDRSDAGLWVLFECLENGDEGDNSLLRPRFN